jgi:hypothetical protein
MLLDDSPENPQADTEPAPEADTPEEATAATEVASPDNSPPALSEKLKTTALFLALSLAAAGLGWTVHGEFMDRAVPLPPSGMPGEVQADTPISLYGLEHVMAILGVPPRQSSFFNRLEEASGNGMNQNASFPGPNQARRSPEADDIQREFTTRRHRVSVYLLILGIPLGAAIGLAESLRRKSAKLIVGGLLVGAILGGAAGFLAGSLHVTTDRAMQEVELDTELKLMAPQFVAWSVLGLGLIVWPLSLTPNVRTALQLSSTVIAGSLFLSLVYILVALQIYYDDRLAHSIPSHAHSFLFWFLFGSGILSVVIGHSRANNPLPPEAPTT